MSKTINRIVDLITELDLSARQFDISIGSANGYTLRMQKNNASVGSDVIERIAKKYPRVNLVWLITGQGEMFKEDIQPKPALSDHDIQNIVDREVQKTFETKKQELLSELMKEMEATKKQ